MLSLVMGCGDADAPRVPYTGSGGSGGGSGTGGAVGTGGMSGMGGMFGVGGSGGTAGGGGMVGTGGTAGGNASGCTTNALCHACPTSTCNVDSDCSFLPGLVCVPTGCAFDGEPQKECQPARYISCDGIDDCPPGDYECRSVGGPLRCVRNTPGCTEEYEDYDCPPGFSCEDGACVDRRVPCDTFADCPKNHACFNVQNASTSRFCVSVFRTCHVDTDCSQLGSYCVDVDGDDRKECTGERSGVACENAACADPSAPVCEAGATGTTATCGQYGLCLEDTDCSEDFVCAALWQDGRKECIPTAVIPPPDACDEVTDCAPNRVCASPRNGGSPSCQAGKEAM